MNLDTERPFATVEGAMRDTLREAMDAAKAVQQLSDEAKGLLLAGLVGRMAVKDPEGLIHDIREMQAMDAEMAE